MTNKRKAAEMEGLGSSGDEELFDEVPELPLDRFHRFLVTKVDVHDHVQHLTLRSVENGHRYYCIVDGQWNETRYEPHKFVNIRSPLLADTTFTVNNLEGIIVYSPDTLISCTAVAGSLFCRRKAWLSEKYRGWAPGNQVMLLGSIVHEIFQSSIQDKIKEAKELMDVARKIIGRKDIMQECYAQEFTEAQIRSQIKPYLPHIMQWINLYMSKFSNLHEDDTKVKVLNVHDIEENIWSPRYGLKGKVDVSCEVLIHEKGRTRKKLVPMELKTGKSSFSTEHQAQASLYTMMQNRRRGQECDSALLVYLKDGPMMKHIPANKYAQQSLIQRRNEVAYYLRRWKEGPEFKDVERICSKCEHLIDCTLHAKYFEPEQLAATRELKLMEPTVIGHLNKDHINFFGRWVTLLNLELEADIKSSEKDIYFWNETSLSREERGIAIGKLKCELINEQECEYKFERRIDSLPKLSEIAPRFKLFQKIAVSLDEDGQTLDNEAIAMAFGMITSIENEAATVLLDQPLQKSVLGGTFRIDLLTSSASYAYSTHFTNLLRLMMPEDPQCQRLRELFVERRLPTFKNQFTARLVGLGKPILKGLSMSQQKAILRTLSTSDYLMIDGTEETGKYETIVAFVRWMSLLKKSVLITAHSSSSIDAILLKLKDHKDIRFVRLGSKARAHPDLRQFCADEQIKELKSPDQLSTFYQSVQIVATTCLSIYSHPLFESRTHLFDYCLVDESSTTLMPAYLGPLFYASKFIFVGDSDAEKPKLRNVAASSEEDSLKADSLFSFLSTAQNSVRLTKSNNLDELKI